MWMLFLSVFQNVELRIIQSLDQCLLWLLVCFKYKVMDLHFVITFCSHFINGHWYSRATSKPTVTKLKEWYKIAGKRLIEYSIFWPVETWSIGPLLHSECFVLYLRKTSVTIKYLVIFPARRLDCKSGYLREPKKMRYLGDGFEDGFHFMSSMNLFQFITGVTKICNRFMNLAICDYIREHFITTWIFWSLQPLFSKLLKAFEQ